MEIHVQQDPKVQLRRIQAQPVLVLPARLLPILGYSDIPLVGGSRLSVLTIIILSHLLLTDEFPVANPIKHGRNHFVRRLHRDYAAGEVPAGATVTRSISLCIAGYGPTLCVVSPIRCLLHTTRNCHTFH